jgi:hypothetical protein
VHLRCAQGYYSLHLSALVPTPDVFMRWVLACPSMGSMAYKRAMLANGGVAWSINLASYGNKRARDVPMMYNPPTFLTLEVLSDVFAEFSWPAPYTLEEDPDGIEVCFPRCHLYVTEGFESSMALEFLPQSNGLDHSVSMTDALAVLREVPGRTLPAQPTLIDYFSPQASLEKVKNELRDLCTLLFTYFRSSLEGDFEWVAAYLSAEDELRKTSRSS